ncbi:hypothetical protein NECAME_14507 [Necator americanus]|uniref:Uncharacterized protein n=1 Tax=Necator americanus TaxID=51031 RepID=W2SPR8_NECAM|nr:hypothetical protein NECAME_14507 [Necator americanus]ETN70841.1 hypothetical protein NECAME_14507 [Necator americanus]
MKVYSDPQQASTSQATLDTTKGHHRRASSLWVPPSRPIFSSPTQVIREKAETGGRILKRHRWTRWLFGKDNVLPAYRIVTPNNQSEPPPRSFLTDTNTQIESMQTTGSVQQNTAY